MKWWWLSFVDPKKPEGKRFLGAALVQAHSPGDAIATAWDIGVNPGGEVMILGVPEQFESRVEPEIANRLLTREEAEAFDRKWSN